MYEYVAFKMFEYKLNEFRGNLKFMNPEKNAQNVSKKLQALRKMKFNIQFIFG